MGTMSVFIKNGLLIDPRNQVQARLNLLLRDGKVAAVTAGELEADQVIDAAGLDFDTDTYDHGLHLNLYGAEKLSHWFGAWLTEHCPQVEDRRGQEPYESIWAEKSATYAQRKTELEAAWAAEQKEDTAQ